MGRSHHFIKTKFSLDKALILAACWLAGLTWSDFKQPTMAQSADSLKPQPTSPQPAPLAAPLPASNDQLAPPSTPAGKPAATPPATLEPPAEQLELPKKPTPSNPEEFPPNPLESKAPDPLLPNLEQPLSPLERMQLIATLDALNLQAAALHQAGKKPEAYEIWFRELRLRRRLGLVPEIEALGRVGNIVWSDTSIDEVRWITERLDTILMQAQAIAATTPQPAAAKPTETEPAPDNSNRQPRDPAKLAISPATRISVLEALGTAYQQVRYPQRAAAAYEAVLADARQRQDGQKIEQTSITLGQLYLSWFNYPKAAETYRELLTTAQTSGNISNQISHLASLAYIHEQAKQPDQAVVYQLQQVELYQKLQQAEPLPRLRIQLGDNYLQADRPDLAEQNYQVAYKLAQPLLQFGNASEALQKLGALYRANDRLDAALRVYTFLLALEQQAYNAYGTMDAYDQLGQIYRLRKENAQALTAFQQGLQIARQLKYREDYFLGQVQQVGQSSGQ